MKKKVFTFLAVFFAVVAVVAMAMRNDVFEQNVKALADLVPAGWMQCVEDEEEIIHAGTEAVFLCDGCQLKRGVFRAGAFLWNCYYTPDDEL